MNRGGILAFYANTAFRSRFSLLVLMSASDYKLFEDVTVVKESDSGLAVLLTFDDGEEKWVPKSVIAKDDHPNLVEGDECDLSIKQWFCDKEGL